MKGSMQEKAESPLTSVEESYVRRFIVSREELWNGTSHLFTGSERENVPISFFWDEYSHGQGPKLHKHPYEEIHIVEEGTATFTLTNKRVEVNADQVVIVPKYAPHAFVNNSGDVLKIISIHCSGTLITEYF
jgi:mannose-6-phosphate isomerase-like protein (cupin superfamily)